ncbi:MAG: 50S ribosomal protein L9 [Planctomycetota bacterium]
MKTRIILRSDLPTLGRVGEVVEVSSGFARNYLLPRGLAYPYSGEGLRRVEKDRKAAEIRRAAQMEEFESLAENLRSVQLTFEERASEEGHLFGSVNVHRIFEALQEKGFSLGERAIRLEDPLRNVGEYDVPVHLHDDLVVPLKVWVVAREEKQAS